MTADPAFPDILAAHARIRPWIHKTPVHTCAALDALAGMSLFFKAENEQKTGSFKFRGATNAVQSLSEEEAANGVAAHSSGNHAQALALAAARRGVSAYLVMPAGAPAAKRAAVESYGGRVTECAPDIASREGALRGVIEKTGAAFVHSYDDPRVIAGQGTAALEFLKERPEIEVLVAPVGGGGLLSGTAIAARALRPGVEVWGAEPESADDAYESLRTNRVMPARPPRTVADGLRTPLSERTFKILRECRVRIARASEREILDAMRLLWERAKIVVEPSGAVGLAAALRERGNFEGRKIGIILSGGNVDVSLFKDYFRGDL